MSLPDAEAWSAATRLALASPLHRRLTIEQCALLFDGAQAQGQMLFLVDGQGVLGLITWAWLNAETEAGFLARTLWLTREMRRSGDRLWVVDLIAPWGHIRPLVRQFEALARAEGIARAKWKRSKPDGSHRRTGGWSKTR